MNINKSKKFEYVISIMLIVILFLNTTISYASQKSDLEKEKSDINKQIQEKNSKIEDVKNQMSDTRKQINNYNSQIGTFESEIDVLQTQISTLEVQITEKQSNIEIQTKKFEEQQELLNKRLVAMYEAGTTSYLDMLLSSDGLADFISKYYIIEQLAQYDTDLLKSIDETKKQIEKEKTELEASKQQLEGSKITVVSKKNSLAVIVNEKNALVTNLTAEEQALEKELQELKQHENSVNNKIKELQKAYDAKMGNVSFSGKAGWPVSNAKISTRYGVSGRYWSLGYHTGVDFSVPTGTPIFSIRDGEVVDAGYNGAYGKFVLIYHGNNLYSLYAHGSSIQVGVGQTVTQGQQIMSSGATGNVTGPHLHFEIRTPTARFSSCVNPEKYLP